MCDLQKLFSVLDELSPIELSHKLIASGDYDNSGILVKGHNQIKKVLFSLDLTFEAIRKAKRLGADTIVTHHPAIYSPIKALDGENVISGQVLKCAEGGINVISMHLNLDVANQGIDQCLCTSLGGESYKIIEYVDELFGYGREFSVKEQTLGEYVKAIRKNFATKKIIVYGNKNQKIKVVASFCGGGSSHAEKYVLGGGVGDLIVTSDMPHHVIKELIEKDKKIILLPHYVAEEIGFRNYFDRATKALGGIVETCYFDDKRFR